MFLASSASLAACKAEVANGWMQKAKVSRCLFKNKMGIHEDNLIAEHTNIKTIHVHPQVIGHLRFYNPGNILVNPELQTVMPEIADETVFRT